MVIGQKSKHTLFTDYGSFFTDYEDRDDKTTFAIKIRDLELPDYASKNENLRKFTQIDENDQMNERKVIKQIIKESLSDPKEKKYHVNHFIFDFR